MTSVGAMPFDATGLKPWIRDTVSRLLGIADQLGVRVEWADLGPMRRGEYLDDARLIRINSRLQGFQVKDTLGHELAHALLRDRSSTIFTETRARMLGAAIAAACHHDEKDHAAGETLTH